MRESGDGGKESGDERGEGRESRVRGSSEILDVKALFKVLAMASQGPAKTSITSSLRLGSCQ